MGRHNISDPWVVDLSLKISGEFIGAAVKCLFSIVWYINTRGNDTTLSSSIFAGLLEGLQELGDLRQDGCIDVFPEGISN